MEYTYLTQLNIVNTRDLHHITVPISDQARKHLILTGKNGCGKTSVLEDIAKFLKYLVSDEYHDNDSPAAIAKLKDALRKAEGGERMQLHRQIRDLEMDTRRCWSDGCVLTVNDPQELRRKYMTGEFLLAYCRDDRRLNVDICTNPAATETKQVYPIDENPAQQIAKHLAYLEFQQAFAPKTKKSAIGVWRDKLQKALAYIYGDKKLKLKFNERELRHYIELSDKRIIPLEHMSMGYTAVFDIVGNLMMRMASRNNFDMEGIVLIDEVETHLHVSLQREIMPILTELFPNVQFILTSHSPFVLISTADAVVYDLERDKRIEDEQTWLSYEGIVDGYFETDRLSQRLRDKLEEYKGELKKAKPDEDRIDQLEAELDKIPETLALDFVTEYCQLKVDRDRSAI